LTLGHFRCRFVSGLNDSAWWRVSILVGAIIRGRKAAATWFCLALAGIAVPILAQDTVNVWTSIGPDGGAVDALAIDPSNPRVLYAGTAAGGVFKSTDAGESWRPASEGLATKSVQGLAIDPSHPETVYAATLAYVGAGGGIFKSGDGGATWTSANAELNSGDATHQFTAVVIDPASPATLYAVGDFSLFKSKDSGATWSSVDSGIELEVPTAVAIDPFDRSVIYLGASFDGVFRSGDGGASWVPAHFGLPLADSVQVLAADPTTRGTLYAGTSAGVFKSTDGAASWQAANAGISVFSVLAIEIDRAAPSTVYIGTTAGIFRTRDGGSTWSFVAAFGSLACPSVVLDPANSSTLYAAAAANGVVKSTDSGTSWLPSSAGLRALSVLAIAVDPLVPSTILVSTAVQGRGTAGLFESHDAGRSWRDVSASVPSSLRIGALAFDPTDPSTVYAGGDGLLKSTDGATSWSPIDNGLPVPGPTLFIDGESLAIDPQTPSNIYAGLFFGFHVGGAIAKSIDGGESWTTIPVVSGAVTGIAVDPRQPSVLFATVNGRDLLSSVDRSQDAGASWASVLFLQGSLRCVAIESRTSVVYVGGLQGVSRSADQGSSWSSGATAVTRVPQPPLTSVESLTVDGTTAGTVYAGSFGSGVFRSTDAGLTWTAMNRGLANTFVTAVSSDPSVAARVYAGTDGNSVFRATFDNGSRPEHPTRRLDFRP
jgi:photosystem II stability/assembly factor-like uncharacterized protein